MLASSSMVTRMNDRKITAIKYLVMALVFLAILLALGIIGTVAGPEANPSPEQWIAAAHDTGDKKISDMDLTELQITSTAIRVETGQSLKWKASAAIWALGAIAASVVVRVVVMDILRWGPKPQPIIVMRETE